MSNLIKNFLLVAMTSLSFTATFAGTDELDKDPVNQTIQGTVVLRVDSRTGAMAMMQTDALTSTEAEAQALTNQNFQVVPQEKVKSELDRESGASSWYWYNPGYYSGYNYSHYYYYSGYCYSPWYSYSYGYDSYYYYNRYSYYF